MAITKPIVQEGHLEELRVTSRAIRLLQIQQLLYANPLGLTTRDLARTCDSGIRTIQRDINLIEEGLGAPLINMGHDRYGLKGTYFLPFVSFSLHEAMVLFLASRLVMRQMDESNPHVETALGKLSKALPAGLAGQLMESIQDMKQKSADPHYIEVFEQVSIAWSTQRKMKVLYQSLRGATVKEWLIEPYFLEMSSVGYSCYVIGNAKSDDREGITTFKLNRIKEIEVLDEVYEVPEDVNIREKLQSSWGVMWGDEIEVKLRFSPAAARRVKESTWHLSQVIEELPDGGCLFTVRVGSTLEMTPWIRGWGPDVEVLNPPELREQFREWAHKLNTIYDEPH